MAPWAAACSTPSDEEITVGEHPASSTSGEGQSLDEYCAMGRPAVTDISARQRAGSVLLTWQELFGAFEDRTFVVCRRAGSRDEWHRLARVVVLPASPRIYVDEDPLAGAEVVQYGVTEIYD
jgi:hypothetical protein